LITLAIPKGRILDEVIPLLSDIGINLIDSPDLSRKLIIETSDQDLRLLIVRATDAPTYVRFGAADMGIVGSDILFETSLEGLYQPVDLNIGLCRLSLAIPKGLDFDDFLNQGERLRVATKYPKQSMEFFALKGVQVDIIKLSGSMELAPLVGLSNVIIDLVSTGQTISDNGLVELEIIKNITSRLIVNKASFKMKRKKVKQLIDDLSSAKQQSFDK